MGQGGEEEEGRGRGQEGMVNESGFVLRSFKTRNMGASGSVWHLNGSFHVIGTAAELQRAHFTDSRSLAQASMTMVGCCKSPFHADRIWKNGRMAAWTASITNGLRWHLMSSRRQPLALCTFNTPPPNSPKRPADKSQNDLPGHSWFFLLSCPTKLTIADSRAP